MNCTSKSTAWFQSAEGAVTLPYKPGFPHCGPESNPKGGHVTIQYKIYLEFPEGALDQKGFLLDNLSFRDFFEACRFRFAAGLEYSCENFAKYCCGIFCQMSTCHKAQVSLSAIDGVWIGHIMESGRYCDPKPDSHWREQQEAAQIANFMAHRDYPSGDSPKTHVAMELWEGK